MIIFLSSICTCFIVSTKKELSYCLCHENITIITNLGNNRSITSNHRSIWTSMKSKRAGIRTQTKTTWKKEIFFVNKDDLELWNCDALVIDYESHEVFRLSAAQASCPMPSQLCTMCLQMTWFHHSRNDDGVAENSSRTVVVSSSRGSNGKLFLTFMEIITESARAWAKRRT